jgi:hypothetical protein
MTVQLQTANVAENASSPLTVTLSSTSGAGTFSTTVDGPWTSTLPVTIPAGMSSATFFYRDTKAGTATITAAAAGRVSGSQAETVVAGALTSLAASPTSTSLTVGASRAFAATGADAYGNPVAATITWSATGGTLSAASGASTTYTATAVGTGSVMASSGTVSATATVTVAAAAQTKSRVSSITYARSGSTLYETLTVLDSSGQPVPGASVNLRILRNGVLYASGGARTGATGQVTVYVTAPSGCYTTTITGVTATGLTWDGTTPSNSYCF